MSYRIGVDIGGTFTDFALIDDETGAIAIHKQLTTPRDPSQAVLEGIDALLERRDVAIADVIRRDPRHDARDERGHRAQGRADRACS